MRLLIYDLSFRFQLPCTTTKASVRLFAYNQEALNRVTLPCCILQVCVFSNLLKVCSREQCLLATSCHLFLRNTFYEFAQDSGVFLLSWRLFLVHPFSCPYISRLISVINSRKVVQSIMAEARHISESEYVALLAVKVPYFSPKTLQQRTNDFLQPAQQISVPVLEQADAESWDLPNSRI